MKALIISSTFFLLFSLTNIATVYADHVAIVICKSGERGHIGVIAVDANITAGVSGVTPRFRGCAQLLHEISARGYEITRVMSQQAEIKIPAINITGITEQEIEYTLKPTNVTTPNELVFILEKNHHHE